MQKLKCRGHVLKLIVDRAATKALLFNSCDGYKLVRLLSCAVSGEGGTRKQRLAAYVRKKHCLAEEHAGEQRGSTVKQLEYIERILTSTASSSVDQNTVWKRLEKIVADLPVKDEVIKAKNENASLLLTVHNITQSLTKQMSASSCLPTTVATTNATRWHSSTILSFELCYYRLSEIADWITVDTQPNESMKKNSEMLQTNQAVVTITQSLKSYITVTTKLAEYMTIVSDVTRKFPMSWRIFRAEADF